MMSGLQTTGRVCNLNSVGACPRLPLWETLLSLISVGWVIEQLTAYADNFHTAHAAHTAQKLDEELRKLGMMFELLEKMGMKVNPEKSAALFRVRGSFAKTWLQRNTVETTEVRALQIKRPSGEKIIPIKGEHIYLGVKISFQKISTPAANYRQQMVAAAWNRLRPVLCKCSFNYAAWLAECPDQRG